MKKGILRWFDPIKKYGLLFDDKIMKEFYVPESALGDLTKEIIPKNLKVNYELGERNGVVIVSKCRTVQISVSGLVN